MINPNYIPWMSLLGMVGAGIGYLVGGGPADPNSMQAAVYGLGGGCLGGILVRIVARRAWMKRIEQKAAEPTASGPDLPTGEKQP